MTIDPKNLSATATLTFGDEFNSLSLWNGTSGTWTTKYPFAPPKGGSLPSNGEQEWYINLDICADDVGETVDREQRRPHADGSTRQQLHPTAHRRLSIHVRHDQHVQVVQPAVRLFRDACAVAGRPRLVARVLAAANRHVLAARNRCDGSAGSRPDHALHRGAHQSDGNAHDRQGGTFKVANMSTGYHTYGVDWQKDYITYYFDGNQVLRPRRPPT